MTPGTGGEAARERGFAPLVTPDTRVLVLGSLPGRRSLAEAQYYAHPRNQFWTLLGRAIGHDDLALDPYAARIARVLAAGIGLWDVYASAVRAGSLDSAIRGGEAAPLAALVAALPRLRAVAFNGRTAATIGRRLLDPAGLILIDLPSSSPAHAAMSLAAKQAAWNVLGHHLPQAAAQPAAKIAPGP